MGCKIFLLLFFCQVVILCWHTRTISPRMLWYVWSLHECWVCAHKMLIRAEGGIFLPSDLYQVQDHGWVIWLIEALLLQSSGCSWNDRPALQHLWTGVYPLSFVYSWFCWNVCLDSSPAWELYLEFVAAPKMETSREIYLGQMCKWCICIRHYANVILLFFFCQFLWLYFCNLL